MLLELVLGAVLTTGGADGVDLTVESESTAVDPAKSVFLSVRLATPRGVSAELPDLRDRVVGFSLAEDFVDEPETKPDGSTVRTANWRLVPEPCAETYKLKPLAVTAVATSAAGPKTTSFLVPPVYFEPPAAREPVTGEMEADPRKDLPPLSWKLVGWAVGAVLLGLAVVAILVWSVRYLVRRVKEHRMSPIERAWVELDRLLKKGLPGRGRYKDFYVELTMVVRRYIQRKYGIRAPHLTTEEFLSEIAGPGAQSLTSAKTLREFLTQADLIKFAGVEATPEMSDDATAAARSYLADDASQTPATAAARDGKI